MEIKGSGSWPWAEMARSGLIKGSPRAGNPSALLSPPAPARAGLWRCPPAQEVLNTLNLKATLHKFCFCISKYSSSKAGWRIQPRNSKPCPSLPCFELGLTAAVPGRSRAHGVCAMVTFRGSLLGGLWPSQPSQGIFPHQSRNPRVQPHPEMV